MARDRRDTLTLDIFSPSRAATCAVAETVSSLASMLDACLAALLRCEPPRPRFIDFPITSKGPLAEAEKDLIEQLGEQGLKPWSIARRLGRHPSSVTWFMSTVGLKRLGEARKRAFTRQGREVRPFTEVEDAFATECSCAGLPPAAIARKMTERFGYERSRDTVACRLMMLASDEAAREAA